MRYLLLPVMLLGLAGCIHSETVRTTPAPAATTVVTPAPATSSTTVVRTP